MMTRWEGGDQRDPHKKTQGRTHQAAPHPQVSCSPSLGGTFAFLNKNRHCFNSLSGLSIEFFPLKRQEPRNSTTHHQVTLRRLEPAGMWEIPDQTKRSLHPGCTILIPDACAQLPEVQVLQKLLPQQQSQSRTKCWWRAGLRQSPLQKGMLERTIKGRSGHLSLGFGF